METTGKFGQVGVKPYFYLPRAQVRLLKFKKLTHTAVVWLFKRGALGLIPDTDQIIIYNFLGK